MKSETIQELLMFLCTSKFDLDKKEVQWLEKFLKFMARTLVLLLMRALVLWAF